MWCLGHNSYQKKSIYAKVNKLETLHLTSMRSHTQYGLYNNDFLGHKTRCYVTVMTVRPDQTRSGPVIPAGKTLDDVCATRPERPLSCPLCRL